MYVPVREANERVYEGNTKIRDSYTCAFHLLAHPGATSLYQPRLFSRPQHYQFPWRRLNHEFLCYQHQLSGMETTLRREIAGQSA